MKTSESFIELKDLIKNYDKKHILKNINLKIKKSEFVTILGPSGSGKTTILRLMGGFEYPTRGKIMINGIDIKDLPAYKRPTHTIFQNYALFPHLNVKGNIMYPLKIHRILKPNPNPKHLSKFKTLQKIWFDKANFKQQKLNKQQIYHEEVMASSLDEIPKYKKAQKWLDNSDFRYSYWKNFVSQKKLSFEKRFLSRKLTKKEIQQEVDKIIKLVGLEGHENKSIEQLSGGMQQRVALARAVVVKPEILLLDEPFSALDKRIRTKMQTEIKAIQKKLGITFIFVTHDQEEALTLSDRVVVINDGEIQQVDKPEKIYDQPINTWVAKFIGSSNIIPSHIKKKNVLSMFGKEINIETSNYSGDVLVMVRPEDIEMRSLKSEGNIEGEIISTIYKGLFYEYNVKTPKFTFTIHSTQPNELGKKVKLHWLNSNVHVMES